MFKNVASQKVALFAFSTTTGAPKTGDAANITPYLSKDFGAVTALTDSSATEMSSTNAPGWYLFDVTQAETNADNILFTGKSSTANIVILGKEYCTAPQYFTTSWVDSDARVDIGKALGTAVTLDANNVLNVSTKYWAGTEIVSASIPVGTAAGAAGGLFIAGSNAATTISGLTTGALACTTITASDAVEFQSTFVVTGTTTLSGVVTASAGIVNTYPAGAYYPSNVIDSGTAQSATGTTLQLRAGAAFADDEINGATIVIRSATAGAGQARQITNYVSATGTATVATWTTTPSGTIVYDIIGTTASAGGGGSAPTAAEVATAVWQDTTSGDFTVSGSIGKSLFTSGVVPGGSGGLLISGTNSGTTTLGALTVSGTTTLAAVTTSGTVTMNSLTVTNGTTLSGAVTATHASNDLRGVRLSATGVDDIWDEVLAAHTTADTAGWVLNMLTQDTVTLSTDVALGSILGQLLDNGTAWSFDRATDSLEAIRDSAGTAAAVADAVWDEARADHVTAGTFGQSLQLVRNGTAQAGASSTITLDASASAVDDFYNNNVVQIIGGTGSGQANLIESYVGTTNVATMRNDWATTPDATSVFVIHPSSLDLTNLDVAVSTRMPSMGGVSTISAIDGDDLELIIGVDYKYANDNHIEFAPSPSSWPDLTDSTVTIVLQSPVSSSSVELNGTVDVAEGTSQSIRFDVPYSTTSTMIPAYVRYWVKATLASGDYYPLAQGVLRWRDPLEA